MIDLEEAYRLRHPGIKDPTPPAPKRMKLVRVFGYLGSSKTIYGWTEDGTMYWLFIEDFGRIENQEEP